jgi:hypothetical protein
MKSISAYLRPHQENDPEKRRKLELLDPPTLRGLLGMQDRSLAVARTEGLELRKELQTVQSQCPHVYLLMHASLPCRGLPRPAPSLSAVRHFIPPPPPPLPPSLSSSLMKVSSFSFSLPSLSFSFTPVLPLSLPAQTTDSGGGWPWNAAPPPPPSPRRNRPRRSSAMPRWAGAMGSRPVSRAFA